MRGRKAKKDEIAKEEEAPKKKGLFGIKVKDRTPADDVKDESDIPDIRDISNETDISELRNLILEQRKMLIDVLNMIVTINQQNTLSMHGMNYLAKNDMSVSKILSGEDVEEMQVYSAVILPENIDALQFRLPDGKGKEQGE